jgi:hypothetical protein
MTYVELQVPLRVGDARDGHLGILGLFLDIERYHGFRVPRVTGALTRNGRVPGNPPRNLAAPF